MNYVMLQDGGLMDLSDLGDARYQLSDNTPIFDDDGNLSGFLSGIKDTFNRVTGSIDKAFVTPVGYGLGGLVANVVQDPNAVMGVVQAASGDMSGLSKVMGPGMQGVGQGLGRINGGGAPGSPGMFISPNPNAGPTPVAVPANRPDMIGPAQGIANAIARASAIGPSHPNFPGGQNASSGMGELLKNPLVLVGGGLVLAKLLKLF